PDTGVIDVLDSAEIATSESAMGECVKKAGQLLAVLESVTWDIFEAIAKLPSDKKPRADGIRASVAQALRCGVHVRARSPALKDAQTRALQLLTEVAPPPPPVHPSPGPTLPPAPVQPGRRVVDHGTLDFQSAAQAREKLDEIASLAGDGRTLHLKLTWR